MHPASPDATADDTPAEHQLLPATRRRRPNRDDRVAPLAAHLSRRPALRADRRAMRRIGAGSFAAAALMAGTVAINVPVASAAAVPYAVGFEDGVPAIAPGGATVAYLDCPGQVAAAPVAVTDPSANVTMFESMPVPTSDDPRVFVRVGPGGLFEATDLGTWSVSVTCDGFDPFVSSFQVVEPTLGLEVALNRDYDCTTHDAAYLIGDREGVCFTVTNNTGMDLRRIGTLTDSSGSYDYPAAGEVGPGETFVAGASVGHLADLGGSTIDGLRVWAELGDPSSGVFAVSPELTLSYPALGDPLELTATTGLTAATACADQGGLADRTVDAGTPVYLCYEVTNTSGVTYHFHDVDDSVLGSLYADLENDIGTGESMSWSPAQPIVPVADEVHDGTWSSTLDDPEGYSGLGEDFVAVAHATASIHVIPAPVPAPIPTTTTTVAPTPTPPAPAVQYVIVTTEAQPAVAVAASPQLAG